MYYYVQIDRETGQPVALQSCNIELEDNHPAIRLESMTEEEYELALAEISANNDAADTEDDEMTV